MARPRVDVPRRAAETVRSTDRPRRCERVGEWRAAHSGLIVLGVWQAWPGWGVDIRDHEVWLSPQAGVGGVIVVFVRIVRG